MIKNIANLSKYVVYIDEKNLQDAMEILNLVESKGWLNLQKHFQSARELILEDAKLEILKGNDQMPKIYLAILEGFDRFLALPFLIKSCAEEYINKKSEVYNNAIEQTDGQSDIE